MAVNPIKRQQRREYLLLRSLQQFAINDFLHCVHKNEKWLMQVAVGEQRNLQSKRGEKTVTNAPTFI